MVSITKAQTGRASSIFNASKQLGGAVGVALLSTLVAVAPHSPGGANPLPAEAAGPYRAGYFGAAAASLLALAIALAIRDSAAVPGVVSASAESRKGLSAVTSRP
jgi:hypothetical protein